MSIPNLEHIVQDVRRSRVWDFTTKEGLCEYTNACVYALHQEDANFGHLTKIAAQDPCVDPQGRYCSKDVALWKPTGQTVDFIASAGWGTPPPTNAVVWMVNEEDNYSQDKWFAPVEGTVPPPILPPLPPLVTDVNAKLDEILANQSRFQETQARDTAMIIARDDLNTQRILDRLEQIVENAEASGKKILALWLAQQGQTPPVPPGGQLPDGTGLLLLLLKALSERPADQTRREQKPRHLSVEKKKE